MLAALVSSLESDRIDLADLARASGLLRFRAARDGAVVFEAHVGGANRFRLVAAQFWCDVAPILRRGDSYFLAVLDPPHAFCAQASIASYLSSHVVYIAPTIPGTSFVFSIHFAICDPFSSPS